jgi:ankyrin repeat protein
MLKKILIGLLLAATQMQAVIDINAKGVNKQTLFAGACTQGNHDLAKILIQAGVNVNQPFAGGMHPLMTAALRNDIEMVRILLNAGANVNYIRPGGLLCALSYTNNTEIVSLLINAGANVNASANNQSILALAVSNHNDEKVKLLLQAGATVDAQVVSSIFHAGYIQLPILKLLINSGLDSNSIIRESNSESILSFFVRRSRIGFIYTEIVEYLLTLDNIDVNITNAAGKTAFDIACETGNIEIIELFQNYFAAQEAKASLSQTQQTTETSVINIANDTNTQLNVLHQVEVPAHSKAEITTIISKI